MRSERAVENASVDSLPKNSCRWELPGWPGKTIGSSGARWLAGQSAVNSATRTGAARGAAAIRSSAPATITAPSPALIAIDIPIRS